MDNYIGVATRHGLSGLEALEFASRQYDKDKKREERRMVREKESEEREREKEREERE